MPIAHTLTFIPPNAMLSSSWNLVNSNASILVGVQAGAWEVLNFDQLSVFIRHYPRVLLHLLCVVYMCTHAYMCVDNLQQFVLSSHRVLGIELGLSGLLAGTLRRTASFPATPTFFIIIHVIRKRFPADQMPWANTEGVLTRADGAGILMLSRESSVKTPRWTPGFYLKMYKSQVRWRPANRMRGPPDGSKETLGSLLQPRLTAMKDREKDTRKTEQWP